MMKKKDWAKSFQIVLLSAIFWMSYETCALAVPANPAPREITQTDGTKIKVFIRGDEFQNWIETEKGYTVIQDKKTGRWEYGVRDKKGDLVPSGIKVDPAKPLPKSIKPHIIPRRISPQELSGGAKRGTFLEKTPFTPPKYDRKDGLKFNNWPPQPIAGPRNLLFILINFSDVTFRTSAADWGHAIFDATPGVRSVVNYFKDNSYGRLTFVPVTHSQAGSPAGVVTVTIPQQHPTKSSDTIAMIAWIDATLTAASQFVNFNSLDADQNGAFDNNEINVYFILAGYEGSDTTKTPSIWSMHSRLMPAWHGIIQAGNIQLNEWSWSGELNDYDKQLAIGTIVHETGHSLGLPDLYDTSQWDNPQGYHNEGIGIFSVMGSGHLGSDKTDSSSNSSVPVGLDAWSREYLGWASPRDPASCGTLNFPAAFDTKDAAVKLMNPDISSDQYFLIENRYPKSWDTGLNYWYGTNWNGGLLILHIDTRIGTPDENNVNYYDPNSHQGVMPEIACAPGTYYTGALCLLFYQGNKSDFDETTTPGSNFYIDEYTGTADQKTYMAVHNVSSPAESMSADVSPSFHLSLLAHPGNGGSIIATPDHDWHNYACSNVDLQAVPSSKGAPNFQCTFRDWSGDVMGTTNPITVRVNAYKSVIANFEGCSPPPKEHMRNFLWLCGVVGCPLIQLPGEDRVNPAPDEKFRTLAVGNTRTAEKLRTIKHQAAELAKSLEGASQEDQQKIEKKAGYLLNQLRQMELIK